MAISFNLESHLRKKMVASENPRWPPYKAIKCIISETVGDKLTNLVSTIIILRLSNPMVAL